MSKQHRETGRLAPRHCKVRGFARRYTKADIRLLAAMDERHNTPDGQTLKKLCERAYEVFSQSEYERLAGISVSHLYNLRQSQIYRCQRHTVHKTRPVTRPVGERRKPQSDGQPRYIRIDTVHQGLGLENTLPCNSLSNLLFFELPISVITPLSGYPPNTTALYLAEISYLCLANRRGISNSWILANGPAPYCA